MGLDPALHRMSLSRVMLSVWVGFFGGGDVWEAPGAGQESPALSA